MMIQSLMSKIRLYLLGIISSLKSFTVKTNMQHNSEGFHTALVKSFMIARQLKVSGVPTTESINSLLSK